MKKTEEHTYRQAAKRCRLNPREIEMAKQMHISPAGLIRNIPSAHETWKDPVALWVRRLYDRSGLKKLLILMMASAILFLSGGMEVHAEDSGNTVPVYRLYNEMSREHLYTASPLERADCIAAGWKDEGIGWYAPQSSDWPVRRLYHAPSGSHVYSQNPVEMDMLVRAGWKLEGIAFYSSQSKAIEIRRQYLSSRNLHHYTYNHAEIEMLGAAGWKLEGTAWYASDPKREVAQRRLRPEPHSEPQPESQPEPHSESQPEPAEHEHIWEDVIEYRREPVMVTECHTICDACGMDLTAAGILGEAESDHMKEHVLNHSGVLHPGSSRRYTVWVKVPSGGEENIPYVTGRRCTVCGKIEHD